MQRLSPPSIKIYEALGALADERVELQQTDGLFSDENYIVKAKVYSSSRNKFYDVEYADDQHAIMTNDNGSYRKGYLGYPAIALLMHIGKIPVNAVFCDALKNIMRKDINTKYNNDFDKTIEEIHMILLQKGIDLDMFQAYISETQTAIEHMHLEHLGPKKLPPKGY